MVVFLCMDKSSEVALCDNYLCLKSVTNLAGDVIVHHIVFSNILSKCLSLRRFCLALLRVAYMFILRHMKSWFVKSTLTSHIVLFAVVKVWRHTFNE